MKNNKSKVTALVFKRKPIRPSIALSALGVLALLLAGFIYYWGGYRAEHQAALLLAKITPDIEVTADEYTVWREISQSQATVRVEVARQLRERRYMPELYRGVGLISRSLVGLDVDGKTSRQLIDELVCPALENNAQTSNEVASLYLVPWLNPTALDSSYCAKVLMTGLLQGNPDTRQDRARLLAMVLAALPQKQAHSLAENIVSLMASADPANVDDLLISLQKLSSVEFAAELQSATIALANRLMAATARSQITKLFKAIDYLKYEVPPATLNLVLEAAATKMLTLRDSDITRDIYLTLAELKISHPQISFGERADYLMQGVRIYGNNNNIEISDFSGALLLKQQTASLPNRERALAEALIANIRNLTPDEYETNILPYCSLFLEQSSTLDHETLMQGAMLLYGQLNNSSFSHQWECLNDARLLGRLEPNDSHALGAVVIDAAAKTFQSGSPQASTRVAELIELLGFIGATKEQLKVLSPIVISLLQNESDPFKFYKMIAAFSTPKLSFPDESYRDVANLLMSVGTTEPSRRLAVVWPLFNRLSEKQQAQIISTAVNEFLRASDPKTAVEQDEFLRLLAARVSPSQRQQVVSIFETANAHNPANVASPHLADFKAGARSWSTTLSPWIVLKDMYKKIEDSSTRADIEANIRAMRGSLFAWQISAAQQKVLNAAAFKFLNQIAPSDSLDDSMRELMTRAKIHFSTAEVQILGRLYMQELAAEKSPYAVKDYSKSIETLAMLAQPGELTPLLHVLRRELDDIGNIDSYTALVSAWMAVESSANQNVAADQRVNTYLDVLGIPLVGANDRALLINRLEEITQRDFGGELWKFTDWLRKRENLGALKRETMKPDRAVSFTNIEAPHPGG